MNEIFRNNLLIAIPFSILILIGLIMISSASIFIAEANYTKSSQLYKRMCLLIDMISARIKYQNELLATSSRQ